MATETKLHPLLQAIESDPKSVVAFHYACGELEKTAPIYSISVVCLADNRTTTFSRREHSEVALLMWFRRHLVDAKPAILVGWNCNTPKFGYPALDARYRELVSKEGLPAIQVYDLDDVLERGFGMKYCPQPKLQNMCDRNGLPMVDFLQGREEATLGAQGEYRRVELSAERKARSIARLALLTAERKLHVADTFAPDTFWSMQHPLVIKLARPRFEAGQHADAVEAVMKELNVRVKKHWLGLGQPEDDGTSLMHKAFRMNPPHIPLTSALGTVDGQNIQDGYRFIFAGAMQAIRNTKAHSNVILDPERAKLLLTFASLLFGKLAETSVDVQP